MPPYMVSKNLPVCQSEVNIDPNYLRTGKTDQAKKNLENLWQKSVSQKILFVRKVAGRARAEGQNSKNLTQYLSCLTWDQA